MSLFKKQQTTKEQLGQVLIQGGKITSEQLAKVLQMQKEEGGRLGELLVKLGFVSEEDIVQALAIQHDFPYLPLNNYEVNPEVIKLIPLELAKKHEILPIDKMGDILTVVMANPLDSQALTEIEALSKCKIEVFVGTATEIKAAIEHSYAKKETSESGEGQNG